MQNSVLRLFIALLITVLSLPAHSNKSDDEFYGHSIIYKKAETYSSILGGEVSYLVPGGYDEFDEFANAILVKGEISAETVNNVRNLLRRYEIDWVEFDSPGGDLNAGLELGTLIRKQKLNTAVPKYGTCASACALAFLGGDIRLMLGDNKQFGFHRQYYIVKGKIKYGNWRQDTATIKQYLKTVEAKGLTADEIVSTTGLASFSDEALETRHIVSKSRADYIGGLKVILNETFHSPYETMRVYCLPYRNLSSKQLLNYTRSDLPAVALAGYTCQRLPSARREPMLYYVLGHNLLEPGYGIFSEEGHRFIGEVSELVKESGGDIFDLNLKLSEASYKRYLSRRQDAINKYSQSSESE